MSDRINVDFDNTLTQDNVAYWAGEVPEPDEDVIDAVNELYNDGHTIIIWTARQWGQANVIAARCTEWGLKFHGIRCAKGSADLYIDDKSCSPEDFVDKQNAEMAHEDVSVDSVDSSDMDSPATVRTRHTNWVGGDR